MTRVPAPRPIAVIVLLCQLVAAAHAPMLKARTAAQPAPAPAHCAQHRTSPEPGGTEHTTSTNHAGHPGCACGLCPCAQAPALVGVISAPPLVTEHGADTPPYRVPDVPRPAAAFFRPPI